MSSEPLNLPLGSIVCTEKRLLAWTKKNRRMEYYPRSIYISEEVKAHIRELGASVHEKRYYSMNDTEIREAHDRLLNVYKRIGQKFADLDEETLLSIYGEKHLSEVRKYGDGHTLWAVPNCFNQMMDILSDTELVLVVAKFPYLGKNSEFNPHEDLTNIYSWHKYIKQKEEKLSGSTTQKFHFLVWQNDCPVHGNRNSSAEANMKRLLRRNQDLKPLIREQKEVSRHLLTVCDNWLRNQGRKFRVCERWRPDKDLDRVIKRLQESQPSQ